ncbi:MAG: PilZ domain-containing protein [Terracidiphilus sp.]
MKQGPKVDDERRVSQRFKVSAPLSLQIGEHTAPGYTRDLSNRGVYFYLTSTDGVGLDGQFEFVIDLPPEITLSSRCQIRCVGRALRKETTQTDLTGIAAEILDYSITR